MEPIHLQTIAKWLNKTVLEDAIVQNVTTDSRTAGEHSLFVAIKGEHFDGNAFIDEVLKTCAGAIGTNPAF